MKNINNKKGYAFIALVNVPAAVGTVTAFKIAFIAIALAAAWHIPAWSVAKANHTEAAYQAQEMFPQQLFDKLPGGTPGRKNGQVAMAAPVVLASNDTNATAGYWEGQVQAGK